MKILFITGEVHPFSKTGGLADVSAALPKAINARGHNVTVISPLYRSSKKRFSDMTLLGKVQIQLADFEKTAAFYELNYENTPHIFVANDGYFDRDNIYGYDDDAERFTFFNKAVLELLKLTNDFPDVIHVNDWVSGLIPYLLDEKYSKEDKRYSKIKTLLSIHNLEYQGSFDMSVDRFFNTKFNYTYVHFERVNFLKTAIMRAKAINTVSDNYRNEILTRFYGFTLDGALKSRESHLFGIINGIDFEIYNPESDPYLKKTYNQKYFVNGKKANKRVVLDKLGLDGLLDAPMVAFIGRLARQKGIDLMKATLEEVIQETNATFVLIGTGNPEYEDYFRYLSRKYPRKVASFIGFNDELAHLVYAASDIFMMPSLFEPCGLGQLISMRYGALPVVRETGGLKDTVEPYNKYTGEGVGFSFANYNAHEFKDALVRAIDLHNNNQDAWRKLVQNAMKQDHSLARMADQYIKLYELVLKED